MTRAIAGAGSPTRRKLEFAGVMGIEYSLSCPQGGDGTEGDIVSQNAALTAKIVDWVMQVGDPDIPKLFKLDRGGHMHRAHSARHSKGPGRATLTRRQVSHWPIPSPPWHSVLAGAAAAGKRAWWSA